MTKHIVESIVNEDVTSLEEQIDLRLRAKIEEALFGGPNDPDDEDDEDVEPVNELSVKTLKSYMKKSKTSGERAWARADKEEDKSMATDGTKYPEKQKRHMDNASREIDTWNKREKGQKMATRALKHAQEETQIDELIGKGKLPSLINKYNNMSATHDKLSKEYSHKFDSFGRDDDDISAREHDMDSTDYAVKAKRGQALFNQNKAAKTLKATKAIAKSWKDTQKNG